MTRPTMPPRPVRLWRQRGILILLFLVFAASGLLRLGQLDIARAATDDMTGDMQDDEHGADMHQVSDAHGEPSMQSVAAALAAIQGRAEELDRREAEIAERQSRLDAAEELVSARLQELEAAEERLTGLLAIADTAASTDIETLTRFYETMGADEAGPLFAQMDPSFAAGFLAGMNPEAGAGILAELTPEQAYAISVILATRNADVPTSADAMPTR